MLTDILKLVLSLIIILFCCELFTNSIEWLGKKMSLGDGVVGSIFSAVGTCLPETVIPVIAILYNRNEGEEIGVGAILGAPFMLGTLAFFLTGLSVILFRKKRKTGLEMRVNTKILGRDLGFFMFIYACGTAAGFINSMQVKYAIAAILTTSYIVYIIITVKSDSKSTHKIGPLYMGSFLNTGPHLFIIYLQLAIALFGIIVGAETFVKCIVGFARSFGVSPMILSLVIAPIATELPEKFNSIIWISNRKDTLALGNVTGAMVFQSCIPVAMGISATSWQLDIKAVASAALTLVSTMFVFLWIRVKKNLSPLPLLCGGLFYSVFICFLFLSAGL